MLPSYAVRAALPLSACLARPLQRARARANFATEHNLLSPRMRHIYATPARRARAGAQQRQYHSLAGIRRSVGSEHSFACRTCRFAFLCAIA